MARHRPRHHGAVPSAFLAASLLTPAPALAGAHAAVDFDLGAPLGQQRARYAAGLGARLGWRFDLGPVWLQPEAAASFVTFKEAVIQGTIGAPTDIPRVLGGARLGLALTGVVQPVLFGHAGIGWDDNLARGPAGDVGLALDVALVPHFTFGVQAAYNLLAIALQQHVSTVVTSSGPVTVSSPSSPSTLQWISAGIHGGFTF